jgi:DNA-binding MurR/RpiR family transcriptional regulator
MTRNLHGDSWNAGFASPPTAPPDRRTLTVARRAPSDDPSASHKTAFLRRLHESALSPSQQKIADYLSRHYRMAAAQTAAQVAATLQTSEATVIRFAIHLGFRGYPDLRRHLHHMIHDDLTSIDLLGRPLRAEGKERDTLASVVRAQMAQMRAVADLPRDDVARVVKGLYGAPRVYVVGHRASASSAAFFGYWLSKVHADVVTLTSGGSLEYDAFRSVPAGSWLVAIAFPRYPRETVELLDFAREERITVAAVTDTVMSPIAKRADVALPLPTEPVTFVDAACATQALLAALLVDYGRLARERTETMLGRFERAAARHGLFHSAD